MSPVEQDRTHAFGRDHRVSSSHGGFDHFCRGRPCDSLRSKAGQSPDGPRRAAERPLGDSTSRHRVRSLPAEPRRSRSNRARSGLDARRAGDRPGRRAEASPPADRHRVGHRGVAVAATGWFEARRRRGSDRARRPPRVPRESERRCTPPRDGTQGLRAQALPRATQRGQTGSCRFSATSRMTNIANVVPNSTAAGSHTVSHSVNPHAPASELLAT